MTDDYHLIVAGILFQNAYHPFFYRIRVFHECYPSLGGVLVQNWDGRVLDEHVVERDASLEISSIARSMGCAVFAYDRDRWHIDEGQHYWAQSERTATGLDGVMTDIVGFLKTHRANKMLAACTDPDAINMLERRLNKELSESIDCFTSSPLFLEILPKGVNKGTAIDVLCSHYGIEKSNVMSIGDYYNDIDMFNASGLSVAMANAPKEIRGMVDYVTEADNVHCGVAEAIRRFIP